MNPDQEQNAFRTAETIAEQLVYAWNYCATLRALQRHAREAPAVLDLSGHFVSTITLALWDALFLKLAHCSDKRKGATGFPKLFKQLRAYLPKVDVLRDRVDEQEQRLSLLEVRSKVDNWRNQVVAHHTVTRSFDEFYKQNVCSLDEIEELIQVLKGALHSLSLELWNQGFSIEDLGHHAHQGVDRIVKAMKTETEHRH